MKQKTKKRLILVIGASVGVYLAFILYSNIGEVFQSFGMFNWFLMPVVLALVFIAYLLRAFRWDYYLRKLGIDIPRKESYLVFLSGLSMVITPGKLGELIKPFILKDKIGTNVSTTIPVVFIERLTDLIGMIILASVGLLAFQYGMSVLLGVISLVVITIVVIQNRALFLKIFRKFLRVPFLSKYAQGLEGAYDSACSLLRPKPLGFATFLSFFAWGIECFCLYLIFIGLNVEMGLLSAIFIFAFSSIVGVLAMLPGGLGVAEGSIVGLSVIGGLEVSKATVAAILVRFSTLWFGVIIGLFVLHYLYRTSEGNET